MSEEQKQYCVTVKLYTWAEDEQVAVEGVIHDLTYLCRSAGEGGDGYTTGFEHPTTDDVTEDTTP